MRALIVAPMALIFPITAYAGAWKTDTNTIDHSDRTKSIYIAESYQDGALLAVRCLHTDGSNDGGGLSLSLTVQAQNNIEIGQHVTCVW